MEDQNSILDKIIESKQIHDATHFNPAEVISNLLKNVSGKERDILTKRFGLFGSNKETLEQIGKHYDITRERIRQIEVGTIKKIKELDTFDQEISIAENNIHRLLRKYGGLMEENHLINELLTHVDSNDENRQADLFIIQNLLPEKFIKIKAGKDALPGWRLPSSSLELISQSLAELHEIIDQKKEAIITNALIETFKEKSFFETNKDQLVSHRLENTESTDEVINDVVTSLLNISKKIDQNILGEWGLSNWQTIKPKRMSDKAYLILKKSEKPLHFTDITKLINEASFDKKTAYPATIHNELILDNRYVLVGRGIYALKEWGYKPGTVIDIIIEILQKAGQPLSKEQIVEEVLKQRIVRKSTIYLALTNKEKIQKTANGLYTLA